MNAAIVITDAQRRIQWVSRGFTTLTGYTLDEARGRTPGELLQGPETDVDTIAHMRRRLDAGKGFRTTVLNYTKSGERYWLSLDVQPVRDAQGTITHFVAHEADVTETRESTRLALLSARQGLWNWDLRNQRFEMTPDFMALFGYTPDEIRARNDVIEFVHPDDAVRTKAWFEGIARGNMDEDRIEYRVRGSDGRWYWLESRGRPLRRDADGRFSNACGIHRDITREKESAEAIHRLAYVDSTTGLANRAALQDWLDRALAGVSRRSGKLAVLFIDLDNFKTVNDSLGHPAGDRVLRMAADRLRGELRSADFLARLSGDEFVIVLTDVEDGSTAARLSERLREQFAVPFNVQGTDVYLGLSIGIALAPADGTEVSVLLKHADLAMYRVKASGRNGFRFFEPEMNLAVANRLQTESKLRQALLADQLQLHFQPLIDARTEQVIGAEALLRWTDAEWGPVSPAHFVPIAEGSGLIVSLGEWVLRAAARQAHTWASTLGRRIPISVNVSPLQFSDPEFLSRVRTIIGQTGVDPSLLMLELTESALMSDARLAELTLHGLKGLGLRLAIDDFGTGYSSLASLRRFPIDKLKIDRSFVKELPGSREAVAIAAAIIDIATRLNLAINAEGVETAEQAAFLSDSNCDEFQGFLYGRPMSAADFERYLLIDRVPLQRVPYERLTY